jgi:chromosomal replication initiation ATPase DnaA
MRWVEACRWAAAFFLDSKEALIMRKKSMRTGSSAIVNDFQPPGAKGMPLHAASAIIIREVCSSFRMTPAQVVSKSRMAKIAFGRMVAMYLCRLITKASFPRIGDVFYRDHTTVMHAVRRVESAMTERPMFHTLVRSINMRVCEQLVLHWFR